MPKKSFEVEVEPEIINWIINSARNILAQGLGIVESENIVSSSSVKQEAIILNTEGVRL